MAKRFSVLECCARKGGEKLTVLTCYTATHAKLLDGQVDMLLVGDSLGMVVYGMESTLAVTTDMMIAHGKAVAAHTQTSLVVVDMPFGSYQMCPEAAFESAAEIMAHTGAQAVKLEGGAPMAETISFLVERGIPVMGHVGLMPQYFNALGGYRFQGRDDNEAAVIMNDAKAVEDAGAFCVVLEGVKETVAKEITHTLEIPTVGIGASPDCDGQVLVLDDMLGLTQRVPSFVKRYGSAGDDLKASVQAYVNEVRDGTFPSAEYCYPFKK